MWWRICSVGMPAQGVVERLDVDPRRLLPLALVHRRIAEHVDEERVVDLQHEPGGDDRQVLLAHRLGDRGEVLLVRAVVLVAPEPTRSGRRHEHVGDVVAGDRRLEVVDVGLQQLLTDVADRALADDPAQRGDRRRVLLEVVGVVLGEVVDLLLPRRGHAHVVDVGLEAAEAVLDVAEEADLAHLAVRDDVDAVLDLLTHPIGDRLGDLAVEQLGVVGPAVLPLLQRVEQLVGTGQAADVGGEDAIGAALHESTS